ncbi:hypothetical protein C8F04DRAFT_1201968 [Mycena alexandri]|uniref:Uncharacterized protein n=1 Tax=Mycena alexandri TaxID=1745969 RepID=A0AAD6RWY9_9AGAR|nr:hypothetical protein C8F04DRAFT_1201968 [Mycena alexandri]
MDLSAHPIFELWARAIPLGFPEPRIINGGQYAGCEFHEYSSPYINLAAAPTTVLTQWWCEERQMKEEFKSLYPDSHSERLNSSPAFLCASRLLIARLACAHGVFLLRSALHLEAEKVTRELEKVAAAAAAVEGFIQTAKYLSAWLDVPGYKIYHLGTSELWSGRDERIAEGWGQWGTSSSYTAVIGPTDTLGWEGWGTQVNTSDWGTGTGWDNPFGGGTGTTPEGWGTDGTWVGGGGGPPRRARGRHFVERDLSLRLKPAPCKDNVLVRELCPRLYIKLHQSLWKPLLPTVQVFDIIIVIGRQVLEARIAAHKVIELLLSLWLIRHKLAKLGKIWAEV